MTTVGTARPRPSHGNTTLNLLAPLTSPHLFLLPPDQVLASLIGPGYGPQVITACPWCLPSQPTFLVSQMPASLLVCHRSSLVQQLGPRLGPRFQQQRIRLGPTLDTTRLATPRTITYLRARAEITSTSITFSSALSCNSILRGIQLA